MLKKPNRLTQKFHFNVAKKYGTRESYGIFNTITLTAKNYVGPAKIGIVVPNTIHKRAVVRNRIKRLLREAIRNVLIKLPDNTWIVIFASNKIIDKTYAEICVQIDRFVQKISISK